MPDSKVSLISGPLSKPPGAPASRLPKDGYSVTLLVHPWALTFKGSSEVVALLGRLTSAVGYQLTLAMEMGAFQERITSTRNGSITSHQAVYVPADDMTDPAPATNFIHWDATTVLPSSLALCLELYRWAMLSDRSGQFGS